MPALRNFRLYSTFLFCMTFSHALLANTSPAFTVDEDQPLNGTLAYSGAQNFKISIPPYLSTDTSSKAPHYLNFTLDSNGSFNLQGIANSSENLVFEWNATDTTSFSVISGTATITVNPVNDPPQVFILDKNFGSVTSLSVEENEELIGYINITDIDGTVVVPALDNNSDDSLKFTIDSSSPADLNSDGNIDYPLKAKQATGFDYEAPNQVGGTSNSYQIKIDANDFSVSVPLNLDVLVTDQSEAPVLNGPASSTKTIREDAISSTDTDSWYKIHNDSYPGYSANDPDSASTSLTWSFNPAAQKGSAYFSTNSTMQSPLTTVSVSSGTTVYLNYVPDANATGTDTFSVRVTDEAGNHDTMAFSVTINPVNDPPVFTFYASSTLAPLVIASGSTSTFLTLSASDADAGASITYSMLTGYDSQYFTINNSDISSTGITSSSNQPDDDGDGIYRFKVRATETNTGETVDQWVYVEINQPPYFVDKDGNPISSDMTVVISEDESPNSWDAKWAAELGGLQALDPGINGAPVSSITNWTVSTQAGSGVATAGRGYRRN